jgi:hypothetical protein
MNAGARRRRTSSGGGVLRPVAETHQVGAPAWWPVEPYPAGRFVALDGGLTPGMIGSFVADRAARAVLLVGEDRSGLSADDALDFVFGDRDEDLYVFGGLCVEDPAQGIRIDPGCCCDLNSWRDWTGAGAGGSLDLGHDPETWAEAHGDRLVVYSDSELAGHPVETVAIALADLPERLREVQRDLTAFLAAAAAWAEATVPHRAAELIAELDHSLRITAPLP